MPTTQTLKSGFDDPVVGETPPAPEAAILLPDLSHDARLWMNREIARACAIRAKFELWLILCGVEGRLNPRPWETSVVEILPIYVEAMLLMRAQQWGVPVEPDPDNLPPPSEKLCRLVPVTYAEVDGLHLQRQRKGRPRVDLFGTCACGCGRAKPRSDRYAAKCWRRLRKAQRRAARDQGIRTR